MLKIRNIRAPVRGSGMSGTLVEGLRTYGAEVSRKPCDGERLLGSSNVHGYVSGETLGVW